MTRLLRLRRLSRVFGTSLVVSSPRSAWLGWLHPPSLRRCHWQYQWCLWVVVGMACFTHRHSVVATGSTSGVCGLWSAWLASPTVIPSLPLAVPVVSVGCGRHGLLHPPSFRRCHWQYQWCLWVVVGMACFTHRHSVVVTGSTSGVCRLWLIGGR